MTESKLRKVNPVDLKPPQDVLNKIKQKKMEKLYRIPLIKFLRTFFGEGF